jgi:hypothetical protein
MSVRSIITLFGSAKEITAQQMLLALNMNRVQNAVAVDSYFDLLHKTANGDNDVVIYKSPMCLSSKFDWHRYLNKRDTGYPTLIFYTYENMRWDFARSKSLNRMCQIHRIDGLWDPNHTKEHNDKQLIELLKLDKL